MLSIIAPALAGTWTAPIPVALCVIIASVVFQMAVYGFVVLSTMSILRWVSEGE